MDSLNWTTSYNLSSLFSFPSRFIARIRKIDDLFNQDLENHALAAAAMNNRDVPLHRMSGSEVSIPYEFVAMPGPWAFLTSGYFVSLLAMALLLNRIQHTVVPPRRSFIYRVIRSRRSLFHALFYSFFPLDLSSTSCRLALRIPSLFFLSKSLLTLTIILLQTSGLFPSWQWRWFQAINNWGNEKEMTDVCWATFVSICGALTVESLTRGLEGQNPPNTTPFNLFGYAFLLHIYSTPITHPNKGPPSRPDKHVLVTIILPLLQLTIIHFLEIKRRWSHHRLIPTTLCSLLTLIHFHTVLFTSPSMYPLLNYLPCILETLLLLVTVLTCTLNALTQLLLEGEIRHPLFGHTGRLMPKWDEDFGVVLLRLGTASLEATSIAGLGNEVGGVTAGTPRAGQGQSAADQGVVELGRSGVVSISSAGKSKKLARGFANEIKNVKATVGESEWWIDGVWVRELGNFGMGLWAVAKGAWRLLLRSVWYRWRSRPNNPAEESKQERGANPQLQRHLSVAGGTNEDGENLYSRFLSGDAVSDDEDDYEPPSSPGSESEQDSPYASIHASDVEDNDEDEFSGGETANLYTDLLQTAPSTSAPLLLAHMTTQSSSPLTRRRYNQLLSGPSRRSVAELDEQGDEWPMFVQERRAAAVHHDEDDELTASRKNCVVCTVEPREVICWPCRCLALCDDCRLNLASRFPASKHSCPCCRRIVEGYSKIYIP